MIGDVLPMLGVGVRQYVLNKIVTVLVTSNVDKREAWTVNAALTNAI